MLQMPTMPPHANLHGSKAVRWASEQLSEALLEHLFSDRVYPPTWHWSPGKVASTTPHG